MLFLSCQAALGKFKMCLRLWNQFHFSRITSYTAALMQLSLWKKKNVYKKVWQVSWTLNISYKIIFWWITCKWIRNIWLPFPLECNHGMFLCVWQNGFSWMAPPSAPPFSSLSVLHPKGLEGSSKNPTKTWRLLSPLLTPQSYIGYFPFYFQ